MTLLWPAVIAYQNGGKNAGETNRGNEELICLAIAMKEDRRRRLKTQLALNSLNARRKRVLNFACLLLLLIFQRNITVLRPVCTCRRLKRNTGCWENCLQHLFKGKVQENLQSIPKNIYFHLELH